MTKAGYKYLVTYMLACVIYDLTAEFCDHWIKKNSRTYDQMIQAARSGKQNITEGYMLKSLKGYIYLLGIAKGSTTELNEDYGDFLRQKGYQIWDKNDPRVKTFRKFRVKWINEDTLNTPKLPNDPEEATNMLITFCNQQEFLLTRQITSLEQKFINEGGYTENLLKKRLTQRNYDPKKHPKIPNYPNR